MNFLQHLQGVYLKYKLAVVMSLVLMVLLLTLGFIENSFGKVMVYLLVMGGSFLISEFIYFSGQLQFENWIVKHPSKELLVIICTQFIVAGLLVYWFLIADQQSVSRGVRISTLTLRVLFAFPVFFLFYFLAVQKYNLRQLGILRFDYWYISLPIIVLIGGLSYLLFPEGLQFKVVIEENGFMAFITLGFLTAAIPEEITRNLFQSRLGASLNNKSLAWFLASFIWALLHIPFFAFNAETHYYNTIITALGILPIGLLWGYLNQRYRSIIPSVIIHGTNLWGLHNIF